MHRGKAKIRYLVKKAVVEYWEEEGGGRGIFLDREKFELERFDEERTQVIEIYVRKEILQASIF